MPFNCTERENFITSCFSQLLSPLFTSLHHKVLALKQQQSGRRRGKLMKKMLLRWHYWRNISLSLLFYIHSAYHQMKFSRNMTSFLHPRAVWHTLRSGDTSKWIYTCSIFLSHSWKINIPRECTGWEVIKMRKSERGYIWRLFNA